MDEGLIKEVLESMGAAKLRRTGDNIMATCPFAPWTHTKGSDNRPSFSVLINGRGTSKWQCYSCKCAGKKSRGLFYKFKELTGKWDESLFLKVKLAEGDDPSERVKRLKSWDEQGRQNSSASADGGWYVDGYEAKFDINNFADILDEIPQYAIDRGITIEQAKKWKIGFHKQFNRLFFALRDETGRMVGWSGRAIFDEQEPKYLHAQYMLRDKYLYGEAHLDPTKRYGFLMEGFMDVLNLNRLGLPNVLGSMGTGASDLHVDKMCRWFDDICIFPHNDWREFTDEQQREMRAAGKTPPGEDMATAYRDKILAKGKRAVIGPYVQGKKDPGDWMFEDLTWVLSVLKKQREGSL